MASGIPGQSGRGLPHSKTLVRHFRPIMVAVAVPQKLGRNNSRKTKAALARRLVRSKKTPLMPCVTVPLNMFCNMRDEPG
jgi:hypothetical protein